MRLSAGERRVFEALLRRATDGGKIPPSLDLSLRIFEAVLDHAHREARLGLRLLLFALEWLPFLFGGLQFWVPFSRQSRSTQETYLESIRTSRVFIRRALFKGLSTAVLLSHYARPDVQRAVGYDAAQLSSRYRSISPDPEDATA